MSPNLIVCLSVFGGPKNSAVYQLLRFSGRQAFTLGADGGRITRVDPDLAFSFRLPVSTGKVIDAPTADGSSKFKATSLSRSLWRR